MKKVSGDNVPPNDVLIVGQSVDDGCVKTVMRTLGETREPLLPIYLVMGNFPGRDFDLGLFRIWQRRLLVLWYNIHTVPITIEQTFRLRVCFEFRVSLAP